jgi:hypothetical protein
MQAEVVKAAEKAEKEQAGPSGESEDLLTVPLEKLTTVEQVKAAMDAPGVSKTRKQKLKQKLNALQAGPARCVPLHQQLSEHLCCGSEVPKSVWHGLTKPGTCEGPEYSPGLQDWKSTKADRRARRLNLALPEVIFMYCGKYPSGLQNFSPCEVG